MGTTSLTAIVQSAQRITIALAELDAHAPPTRRRLQALIHYLTASVIVDPISCLALVVLVQQDTTATQGISTHAPR